MSRKAVGGVIFAVIVVGAIYLFADRKPACAAPTQETLELAKSSQEEGIMTSDDYLKLMDIRDKIDSIGVISNRDLAWAINLMKTPLVDGGQEAALLHMEVLSRLRRIKTFAPNQKDKIYNAALQILPSRWTSGLDEIEFAKTMKQLGAKRAIPYLIPFLSDSRKLVKENAQKALASLEHG
ncbi:hypothetical protein CCAX7_21590 [Capsulimonas corticalis]|uniref:Uncharacterized protein n=1 Tax=Capsulimonas corticalis TaxID=2219043 RepID=A0A402D225_9BACT|nr:hypothetical protein [Capsulimonas corticalis]BDI30108.1 hypothetical protein CCAX7_21590 [Capsulimonas corticalis]